LACERSSAPAAELRGAASDLNADAACVESLGALLFRGRAQARAAMTSLIGAAVLAATLVACGKAEDPAQAPPPRVEKDSVVFDASSPQLATIQSAGVEPQRDAVLRFNGRLVWNEDHTVRVFSPFAGRVVAIPARVGDRVSAGLTLAVLEAPELGMAQSEASKAEEDFALAQKNLTRVEELQAAGAVPLKDVHAAQADFARARAERARTRERLKLYGADSAVDQRFALRSAISGVVVERNLNPGQEARPDASPDRPYFVVSDPTRLWFLLDVGEADVATVKPGAEVRIAATALGEARVTGRVSYVAHFVDPQTRTVKVQGTVDNADQRLKAEMFITAELKVSSARGLLVPTRAIYFRGDRNYVFVDAGGGRYVRKPVRTGPRENGHQLVLEGLQPTDKVVVDGSLLLEKILADKD
jgi:cobalt-zinc-cadmium efflux system membrane fusion protein